MLAMSKQALVTVFTSARLDEIVTDFILLLHGFLRYFNWCFFLILSKGSLLGCIFLLVEFRGLFYGGFLQGLPLLLLIVGPTPRVEWLSGPGWKGCLSASQRELLEPGLGERVGREKGLRCGLGLEWLLRLVLLKLLEMLLLLFRLVHDDER